MIEQIAIWLIVGGVAGFLGSMIMGRGGLRITGNHIVDTIITGIIGALIGGWLLSFLKVSLASGLVGTIINAVIGAIIFIFGLGLIRK